MDALVQLALMMKCRKVFEQENTFLSFPRMPYNYKKEHLNFVATGGATREQVHTAAEFARTVNSIPRGVVFEGDSEESLWQIYGDVLARAHVAAGTLTPEQQAARDDAMALLYVTTDDGLRQESPQLRAYKQYRDAWFKAQEAFRHAQLSAEESNDAAKLKQWREFDEPAHRARIAEVELDWYGLGFRNEVEAAQRSEESIARSAPLAQWIEWKKDYNPDIDVANDPVSKQSFAVTGFAPSDVLDQDNWSRFQLDRTEMMALAEEAPAELKVLFLSQATTSQVESVSFEFHSTVAVRPWYRSDVFRTRFWRLQDGEAPLSDGATPPSGRCPAYVQALVFARNITVTTRSAATAPPRGGRPLILVPKLPAPTPVRTGRGATIRDHRKPAKPGAAKPPPKRGKPAAPKRAAALTQTAPAPAATSPAVQANTAAAMKRLAGASFHSIQAAPSVPPPVGAVPPVATAVRPTTVRSAIPPPVRRVRPAPPANPAPAQPVTTPAAPPGTISVLAFICRRLPRSPDPDPAFNWG